MRGRANDEKSYDDYTPINLSSVSRIDQRRATKNDKDTVKSRAKEDHRAGIHGGSAEGNRRPQARFFVCTRKMVGAALVGATKN